MFRSLFGSALSDFGDDGDPDGNFNFVMVECARGMFDLMLRYFLPRVPYPFTGLGLFPEAAAARGAVRTLGKPFTADELLAMVDKILGKATKPVEER